MANLAVILCALLLASGVSADENPGMLERLYNKIDGIIGSAIDKAQEVTDGAKAAIEMFTDKITTTVDKEITKIYKKIENLYNKLIVERIGKSLDELINGTSESVPAVCRVVADDIRQHIDEVAVNTSSCVVDTIIGVKDRIDDVTSVSTQILTELNGIRAEARECAADANGIKDTAFALVCLTNAGVRASWVSARKIPEITIKLSKLTWSASTFPAAALYCTAKNGIFTIPKVAKERIESLKTCLEAAVQH